MIAVKLSLTRVESLESLYCILKGFEVQWQQPVLNLCSDYHFCMLRSRLVRHLTENIRPQFKRVKRVFSCKI